MIEIKIPGFAELTIKNAIFDYNGTLAVDGYLIDGIGSRLNELAQQLPIHIVTGDGFGTAKKELQDVNCTLIILPTENQAKAKQEYQQKLNPKETVSIGNGRNDQYLLQEAALGIAVMGKEGFSAQTAKTADVIISDIFLAIDLLQNPRRLIATLRG